MTLADIQANEELRRREFPVAAERIFLAHAGVCPLPRRVEAAMREYISAASLDDQEAALPHDFFPGIRRLAGRLLGAQAEEIALVGPTSLALSMVAAGLQFEPGDNALIYFDDYPSNVYPWMALEGRRVEIRRIHAPELGRIQLEHIAAQVDGRTRLVALASCHFIAGVRLDVSGIGVYLRERGIAFCVDGIQTIGAFPTPIDYVDFLAADAHKWMLGPCSAGVLYVRKDAQERLSPSVYGWSNVYCPQYIAQDKIVFRPNARRYEAGSANLAGLAGLKAALELLLEVGVEAIASDLLRKRGWLIPAIRAQGYEVLAAEAKPDQGGSIIAIYRGGTSMADLHAKLLSKKIVASLRFDRAGTSYLRISPHFYNTDTELERFLEVIRGG